ncbi:MAG: hypothetical protein KDC87_12125 [Planctomycetes bacterium]|nr:hypothetical protein [Planctomycetota bacterium]MCB9868317.1 hypothetical protein [Planctomycetota bacterium]
MAKSRFKASGCRRGIHKPKKMGKGYSAYHPPLGFRPPVAPPKKQEGDGKPAAESSN